LQTLAAIRFMFSTGAGSSSRVLYTAHAADGEDVGAVIYSCDQFSDFEIAASEVSWETRNLVRNPVLPKAWQVLVAEPLFFKASLDQTLERTTGAV
jgi:hypothetical protein